MSDKRASEPLIDIELSIDQRRALTSAALRLCGEFADTSSVETVDQVVYSSYEQFAAHASVHDFLPLPAERFAEIRVCAQQLLQRKPRTVADSGVIVILKPETLS